MVEIGSTSRQYALLRSNIEKVKVVLSLSFGSRWKLGGQPHHEIQMSKLARLAREWDKFLQRQYIATTEK
jgi:hypothetical protein